MVAKDWGNIAMRCYLLLCLVFAALSAGCSTVPDRVELNPPEAAGGITVDLRDGRTGEQMAGNRWETKTSASVTYGDDQFAPSRVLLLRRKLERELGEQLRGRVVTLKDFDVSTSHSYYVNPSISGSGNPLIHAIESAKAERSLRSKIIVDLSGTELEGAAWKRVSIGAVGDGLRGVVSESIDVLITRLREHLLKAAAPGR